MGIRLIKYDDSLRTKYIQNIILRNKTNAINALNKARSDKHIAEMKQEASERHKARGLIDKTSLIRRIVVTPHTSFIRRMYPQFFVTNNVMEYRKDYRGIIYTGDVTDEVMERLEYIHDFIIMRNMFDVDDKTNNLLLQHVKSEKIVRLVSIKDFILWYFPKNKIRIGDFQKAYAENMEAFFQMLLKCIISKEKLPTKKRLKTVSVYPLFQCIGDKNEDNFVKTLLTVMGGVEPWKVESSVMTFLGRVMDGEVDGNNGAYNKMVRNAHTIYGNKVKNAVKKYVQSNKDVFWKMMDLHQMLIA